VNVVVVGGGVIGLSIAWTLVRRDVHVTVLDDGNDGAWHVAAGMLAPGGEAAFEIPALAELLDESARRWPSFAASLGVEVGYDDAGTLSLAITADDLAEASRVWTKQGLALLRPSELREREPALSPRVRAGVYSPMDRQVDPRRVVAALRERLGRRIVRRRVSALDDVDADLVVVAAGCGTAALTGLPVRPVKGQVLRLRGEPGLIKHVLEGPGVYVVPRADGEIIVGATQEERADSLVTAGAVHDLLRDAIALVPALAECSLTATLVGHRPSTPDNAPLLGFIAKNVLVAAGHHRNGVLLAPVTADLIADLVLAGPVESGPVESGPVVSGRSSALLAAFAPGRFSCA
jgi:glycine oxidase